LRASKGDGVAHPSRLAEGGERLRMTAGIASRPLRNGAFAGSQLGCRIDLPRLQHHREVFMSDMRLIVAGAGGRMGRALTRVISETSGAVLTGALEAPGSELLGKDAGVLAGLPENGVKLSADLWTLSANADGILDFTVPAATIANVAIAAERGLVHVIGTTGLSDSDEAVIKSVTKRAIVVKSGNMSLGVNLLAALVKRVAQSLDESFDIEVLEMHHRAKIDAPSGTALMLGEAAASGRRVALDQRAARGRGAISALRRCAAAASPAITA
jgi:4-hydroxy-tetrahydrodipicolinate reductase